MDDSLKIQVEEKNSLLTKYEDRFKSLRRAL